MMYTLVNLTQHALDFVAAQETALDGGPVIISLPGVPRSDWATKVVRVAVMPQMCRAEIATQIGVVSLFSPPVYGEVTNLPEPVEGTILVVSGMVVSALAERGIRRPDVMSPSQLQRGADGKPSGALGLQ